MENIHEGLIGRYDGRPVFIYKNRFDYAQNHTYAGGDDVIIIGITFEEFDQVFMK